MKDIQITLIGVVMGFLFGFLLASEIAFYKMKSDSLKGYKAKAIYFTNDLGEIKISKIEWSK